MKKILILVIILSLPVIAFVQYKNYSKFNPSSDFNIATDLDSIDVDYYQSAVVEEYIDKLVGIPAYARSQWRNEGIDVLYPKSGVVNEQLAADKYKQMLKRLYYLESKLIYSKRLKEQGYNNDQIQWIEAGESASLLSAGFDLEAMSSVQLGDEGEMVWLLQKKLADKGLKLPIDGVFGDETANAVRKVQLDHGLYPSGRPSISTLKVLF